MFYLELLVGLRTDFQVQLEGVLQRLRNEALRRLSVRFWRLRDFWRLRRVCHHVHVVVHSRELDNRVVGVEPDRRPGSHLHLS